MSNILPSVGMDGRHAGQKNADHPRITTCTFSFRISRVPSANFSEVLQSVVLGQLAHLRTMR
jgi:hypothetical protein